MPIEPVSAVAALAAYNALPDETKKRINEAVSKLIGLAAPNVWRWFRTKVWGTADDRVMKRALRLAVAQAVTGREELDTISILHHLIRPPLATFIVQVVRQPLEPLEDESIRCALDAAGYQLEVIGVDGPGLIRSIQESLLEALRADPDAQAKLLHLGVRAEQTIGAVQDAEQNIIAEIRSLRGAGPDVTPALDAAEPMWLPQALRGLYMQSRQAFVAGRLDEAKQAFTTQLEEVYRGELAPGRVLPPGAERAWKGHAQDLLLSLAQVAILQDERAAAAARLAEATALGSFEGRARYFAGWVLTNLVQHPVFWTRADLNQAAFRTNSQRISAGVL